MTNDKLNIGPVSLKPFVPALDFELSKKFYQDIGFQLEWSDGNLAHLQTGTCGFLLQNYFVEDFANNMVLHLTVNRCEDLYKILKATISKYSFPVYLEEITMKEWGVRDFVFKDPSGVMWRVAEIKKENTI
ncbi:MAG: hypothetical protein BGO09_08695 [Bacteroidetes bacterium 47-18]|nr:MAG: hypothetical protein BGO09_08695 [Bacteroidetes bacterium 47-18]